jgi:hypothetical protein
LEESKSNNIERDHVILKSDELFKDSEGVNIPNGFVSLNSGEALFGISAENIPNIKRDIIF